jgi:hypothetical protein
LKKVGYDIPVQKLKEIYKDDDRCDVKKLMGSLQHIGGKWKNLLTARNPVLEQMMYVYFMAH